MAKYELSSQTAVVVAVAISALNDEQSIESAVTKVVNLESQMRSREGFENLFIFVVVCDRGSKDRTLQIAKQCALLEPRVSVLDLAGAGSDRLHRLALFDFTLTGGVNLLVEVDSLKCWKVSEVELVIEELYRSCELAYVAEKIPRCRMSDFFKGRLAESVIKWIFNKYFRLRFGFPVSDWLHGVRGWRIAVVPRLAPSEIQTDGILFGAELLVRCIESGSRVFEIPTHFDPIKTKIGVPK